MNALKQQIFILTLVAFLFFFRLGTPKLWDRDEPRNARCAVEMLERNDWTVPTFNDELRTHKPILLYWLMMSAYSVFGINEFAARFWSAVASVGTVWITYRMGRRLYCPRVAFFAALILSTAFMFNVAARAATPDAVLIFFMTLALGLYVRTSFPEAGKSLDSVSALDAKRKTTSRYSPKRVEIIPIYLAMGMAVLAKGPIGIVLPTAIIELFLAITRAADVTEVDRPSRWRQIVARIGKTLSPVHLLKTAWAMHPLTAVITALSVALPWYLAVAIETDGEWIRSFLMEHNIGRASSPLEGHSGSALLYYPVAIAVGFFPWSVFAVPVFIDLWQQFRTVNPTRTSTTFLLCWAGVIVCVFSLAQTKLPNYVTPAYPALALLTAGTLERVLKKVSHVPNAWLSAAAVSLSLVGLVGIAGIYVATSRYFPGEESLALLACVPLLSGAAGFYFVRRKAIQNFLTTITTAAIATTILVFGFALPRISTHQTVTTLFSTDRPTEAPLAVASYAVHEPSWVFYARRTVPFLRYPQKREAIDHLSKPNAVMITTAAVFQELQNEWKRDHAGELSIVAEVPYFLKKDQLLMIQQQSERHSAANQRSTTR